MLMRTLISCVIGVALLCSLAAHANASSRRGSGRHAIGQRPPSVWERVADGGKLRVVDIRNVTGAEGSAIRLAVLTAAGIESKTNASVYVVANEEDIYWLDMLVPPSDWPRQPVTWSDFLSDAYARFGAVLYFANDTDVLPSVATSCGALGAVAMDTQYMQPRFPSTRISLDTVGLWANAHAAVDDTTSRFLNVTASLAIQDPSLLINGYLSDWIAYKPLFVQFLEDECLPFFPDGRSALRKRVDDSNWPTPVRVYGYNSLNKLFGGDLFEAETDCINTMGQVASSHRNNLPFWSQFQPFDPAAPRGSPLGPLVQPKAPASPQYNRSKTYVALVYGDMDNLDFVFTFGRQHMEYRAARCALSPSECFPLVWTLSSNLVTMAPQVMRWYYEVAAKSGQDWFIMPPSGDLYSYPGLMPAEVQSEYVEQQTKQALVMDTIGSIHWEWVLTWSRAWETYFPRYENSTGTRAFFLNDVPYVIPIPDLTLRRETFRWVGAPNPANGVVGFKPAFNWQEGGNGGDPGNSTHIAQRINNLKKGTVQYVYVIQNTPTESLFDMVAQLDDHVVLVQTEQLVDLAAQHARRRTAGSSP